MDPKLFASKTFDYLIIGGGTAGLTVASRLAEDETIQVGVIEAGDARFDDPLINVPANTGRTMGNPAYDWGFMTAPQEGANGRTFPAARGKGLGGCSSVAFLSWNRASKFEYDAWDAFASDKGWNWEGLLPYFRKSTAITADQLNTFPGISAADASAGNNPEYSGFDGPIQLSYNKVDPETVPIYVKTLNKMGIHTNPSPENGELNGVINSRMNIDSLTGTRSYAATAYFRRSESRNNFHLLTKAQVTKILSRSTGDVSGVEITGVEFQVDSQTFVAHTRKEVILAAGAYQSPQLLELSGIGNRSLLESFGIPTVVDLPEVGENLQDHYVAVSQHMLKPGILTFDELRNNPAFAAEQDAIYAESHGGMLASFNSALSFLPFSLFLDDEKTKALIEAFDQAVLSRSKTSPLQAKQYAVQREWFTKGLVPQMELILFNNGFVNPEPGKSYITVLGAGLHHISRGSVHIKSKDPLSLPTIDPSILDNEFDVKLVLEGAKLLRRVADTAPLVDIIESTTVPPSMLQTDEELISFVKASVGTAQHPMGTVSMGPQELGGVVDGDLKVYGTKNLRVCDASILPVGLGAHLQATVYAVAEKLADMIKVTA
ncbi:alcohol oxidase [Armillaria gallica]|uniref:Alcohol oxidase n=1 Tax=Armillaria gallica TaxID=47427 RepID=A0A2H3DBD8_ARMGA|nr:alcohol oxidase [Armillaria gallica]